MIQNKNTTKQESQTHTTKPNIILIENMNDALNTTLTHHEPIVKHQLKTNNSMTKKDILNRINQLRDAIAYSRY